MSIFDDNVLDENISHVEESDNTFLIFMLSYFRPKFKLRLLHQLLTWRRLSADIRKKIPVLSLTNSMYVGPVPSELKDLTPVEEAMIAWCWAKCWIKGRKSICCYARFSTRYERSYHYLTQWLSGIANLLPPSKQEILTPVCVLFVGSTPPTSTAQWLHEKAKLLCIHRDKLLH